MHTKGKRARRWPRMLSVVCLASLGACGAALLVVPPQSKSSVSLAARTNWVISGALPASRDFPNTWGYSISGPLRKTPVPSPAPLGTPPRTGPRAVYTTSGCSEIPALLSHAGAAEGPVVSVDRYTELLPLNAALVDDDATGGIGTEQGPNARFEIWFLPDGPAQILQYIRWLDRCNSYGVTTYDYQLDGRSASRAVTTVVEGRPTDGAEASVRVTRTFTTAGSQVPPLIYHVTYYAVRGLVLQCAVYMEGADRELVMRRATETTRRLWAL